MYRSTDKYKKWSSDEVSYCIERFTETNKYSSPVNRHKRWTEEEESLVRYGLGGRVPGHDFTSIGKVLGRTADEIIEKAKEYAYELYLDNYNLEHIQSRTMLSYDTVLEVIASKTIQPCDVYTELEQLKKEIKIMKTEIEQLKNKDNSPVHSQKEILN